MFLHPRCERALAFSPTDRTCNTCATMTAVAAAVAANAAACDHGLSRGPAAAMRVRVWKVREVMLLSWHCGTPTTYILLSILLLSVERSALAVGRMHSFSKYLVTLINVRFGIISQSLLRISSV